jgi:hypothetical protein
MSKQLYEEAIADVKKLKEIAEDNAKRAVIEAVAPRIRELIEKELLGEASASPVSTPDGPAKSDKVLTDDEEESEKNEKDSCESVVVSLGELGSKEDDDTSQVQELSDVVENFALSKNIKSLREFHQKLRYVDEMINGISSNVQINESNSYSTKNIEISASSIFQIG